MSLIDVARRLLPRAKLQLVDDWRVVLKRAWSLRLIALAVLLTGLETAIGVMTALSIQPPMPPGIFAAVAGVVGAAAFGARLIAQPKD